MKRRFMVSRSLGALAAGAALAVVLPAAGFAQAAPPIRIDSCDVKMVNSQTGLGNLYVNGKGYNFFNVTFTNTGSVAAKKIVFQIEFNKSRYVVGDAGSFAPGDQVTHHLRDRGSDVQAFARTDGSGGPTVCSVLSVDLSDGTSWSAPPTPAPSPSG